MDDFLHNLRSGKLKQTDRSGRSYGDPQYKNKRNVMDRRKRDQESKESFERLNAIKEILETVSETQRRMAEFYKVRIESENRKAKALEVLAKSVYRMANPNATDVEDLFTQLDPSTADKGEAVNPTGKQIPTETVTSDASEAKENRHKETGDDQHQKLFELIDVMRNDGSSWEKIARQIAAQGFPTVSGRGSWRGVMVKNLYEKMKNDQ